jgi:hypothetical protein
MSKRLIIYRLHDTTYGQGGNAKTLSVRLAEDNVLNYSYYGGWQDSGSGFSISNMQLKESLPMGPRNFKNVEELNKKIQSILKTGVGSSKVASYEILNDL